jgi:guanylate kinase
MKSRIFIISGPSGSGEDSVIGGLKDFISFEKIITTTTRKPRPDDIMGKTYHFISKEEFKKNIQQCKFVEYAQQYNNEFYGVTKSEIARVQATKKIGIWKIEYQGVLVAKKIYPKIKSIFLYAPLSILKKRMHNRSGMTEKQIQERLIYTKEWFKHRNIYDFQVENKEGHLDKTIQQVVDIIKNDIKDNN